VELEPLDNARWGFPTNCFVCEASNPAGLRIPFFCDRAQAAVVADFTLSTDFSGAPRYAHGGVLAAVVDEAMAWAAIALAERFALTRQLRVDYQRPVRIGLPYRVAARLGADPTAESLRASAVVSRPDGKVCVLADASLAVLGEARAADAIGSADLENVRQYTGG
jgi:acyl-coenzyme A thioesterase PaaI-like protein